MHVQAYPTHIAAALCKKCTEIEIETLFPHAYSLRHNMLRCRAVDKVDASMMSTMFEFNAADCGHAHLWQLLQGFSQQVSAVIDNHVAELQMHMLAPCSP